MFLDRILAIILKILLARAEKLARGAYVKYQEAEKRGEINEENVIEYNAATDRAQKIKAAVSLLNGTKSS